MKHVQIAVLALGALVALVALAGCGSSKTHGEEATLKLIQPGGSGSKSNAPIGKFNGRSFTPGNGIAISNLLQNSEKKAAGEINAICIDTQPPSGNAILSGTCTGTATVPGGTFALNVGGKGVIEGKGVSGAITGGTGKYNGALGNFSSKPTSSGGEEGPKEVNFNYILP